ncbi:hypothetical protein K737_301031 [Holospora undulata HU1]|uniref:Uncharacterized protein n=2 Tax=Holospora TaxID=44747 RepID=A0A061JHY0_9PROT|nr:hypothetical protein K737_301031 [Holospora undulata HU1]
MKKIRCVFALMTVSSVTCFGGGENVLNDITKKIEEGAKRIFQQFGTSENFCDFLKKVSLSVINLANNEVEINKALRSMALSAFAYNLDSTKVFGSGLKTLENFQRNLKQEGGIEEKLPLFEAIVLERTSLSSPTDQGEPGRWRFLRSIFSFENAVYPEDRDLALADISAKTKKELACECLLICGADLQLEKKILVEQFARLQKEQSKKASQASEELQLVEKSSSSSDESSLSKKENNESSCSSSQRGSEDFDEPDQCLKTSRHNRSD